MNSTSTKAQAAISALKLALAHDAFKRVGPLNAEENIRTLLALVEASEKDAEMWRWCVEEAKADRFVFEIKGLVYGPVSGPKFIRAAIDEGRTT